MLDLLLSFTWKLHSWTVQLPNHMAHAASFTQDPLVTICHSHAIDFSQRKPCLELIVHAETHIEACRRS